MPPPLLQGRGGLATSHHLFGYLHQRLTIPGCDAADGKAYLLGHTFANGYTIDYLAVFWIGMATLSVLCALTVWRSKR